MEIQLLMPITLLTDLLFVKLLLILIVTLQLLLVEIGLHNSCIIR
jgi:hypothetical protein